MILMTSIGVSDRTRRRLAHARDQLHATSMDEALDRLLTRFEREQAFASEREATRLDARNPEAMAEQDIWAETLADGIE